MTKVTADKSDIVTPGSVLVRQKDGLLMYSIDTKVQPTSTYKNGKISMGFGTALGTSILLGQMQPGANTSNVPQRKFVAGEKFWVTAFDIQEGNVVLQFYSDPYENVRYQGQSSDHCRSDNGTARQQRNGKRSGPAAGPGSSDRAGDGANPASATACRH